MHKVIHFVFALHGGAGKVASQINYHLNQIGFQSRLVYKSSEKSFIDYLKLIVIYTSSFIDNFIIKKKSSLPFFSVLRTNFGSNKIFFSNMKKSIIHLHWIPGLIKLNDLIQLNDEKQKFVVTLHDTWFFTGGCHYNNECSQYQTGCRDCPMVHKIFRPLVSKQFDKKFSFFSENKMVKVTSPSQYLLNKASESLILKKTKIELIRHPFTNNIIFEGSKKEAKIDIGIDINTLTIGFVSTNILDPRKNFVDAYNSVKNLVEKQNSKKIKFIVIGSGPVKKFNKDKFILRVKNIKDPKNLSKFYAAFDILIITSLQENYPLVGIEGLLNKTYLIVSNQGGTKELIKNKKIGLIYNDFADLCRKLNKAYNFISNRNLNEYQEVNISNGTIINKFLKTYGNFEVS